MKIVYTDVLVIGGGLAGLRMAIGAKRRGHEAVILSLVPAKRSHSKAAQGGMQASLGNVIKGQGDNEDVHFEDTVRGSDWGADQRVVRMFVDTAPKAVRELAAWGVPWSRVRKGDRDVIINGQTVKVNKALRNSQILDSDGDGIPNYFDPTPFDSVVLAGSMPAPQAFAISWQALPNIAYRVEYTTNAAMNNWQTLTTYTNHGSTKITATVWDTNSAPGAARKFYRVSYPQP